MLGTADVCGIGVGAGAGDVAQLAAQLVLGAAGRAPSAARSAGTAALRDLQGCFFLLVLLALKVFLIRLEERWTRGRGR